MREPKNRTRTHATNDPHRFPHLPELAKHLRVSADGLDQSAQGLVALRPAIPDDRLFEQAAALRSAAALARTIADELDYDYGAIRRRVEAQRAAAPEQPPE